MPRASDAVGLPARIESNGGSGDTIAEMGTVGRLGRVAGIEVLGV